ncbi:MAG: stage II sporulation protein P, partial [Eubacteriales bacterium]|nr:stage II sporulation protein P [Eubacteriales bacterium]
EDGAEKGTQSGEAGPDADRQTESSGGGPDAGPSRETLARLQDYDYLMKHFYSVHASTTADRELVKADMLLGTDLSLEQDASVPQILIYHTHSQETYADYGPDNPDARVAAAGEYLAELLRAKGWNVIHDTSAYDIQGGRLDRSKAYNYALDGINSILQANPDIEVVLDLHRDGVKEGTRLVSQVNGKPAAKIMFFQGMSRTPEGAIEYLPNPNLKENMAFAFQMQLAAESLYPGYTRKIYLKGLRYNLHLRGRSALIEAGAQTNTLEEALNAMEPLAELLDMVLQGK